MSKIGKLPIHIPEDISVTLSDDREIIVESKTGVMRVPVLMGVKPVVHDREVRFELARKGKQARSNWGTLRSLVKNALEGLQKGFSKTLIIEGVGYRAQKEGNDLILHLGFSHPVKFACPKDISVEVEKNTIFIKGIDKQAVGEAAATVRAFKKPEPYKGKGIRYAGEVIRRKSGKKTAGGAG